MLKKISISTLKLLQGVFCCFIGISVYAQDINYTLPIVQGFSLQPLFHNPATAIDSEFSFHGNFHSYLGDFSDVNYSYLGSLYQLNTQRAIGGMILHENTSDFFTRTRVYAIYQEGVQIAEELEVRAAVQAGVVNFNMASIGFGPGGSAWTYDLGIGLSASGSNYSLGFVIQQLTNSKLQPIVFTFTLNNYIDLFAKYSFTLNEKIKYTPEIRFKNDNIDNTLLFSNTLSHEGIGGVNATWNVNQGYSILAFYEYSSFQFFASYFIPLSSNLQRVDAAQYELGLNFGLKK